MSDAKDNTTGVVVKADRGGKPMVRTGRGGNALQSRQGLSAVTEARVPAFEALSHPGQPRRNMLAP